MDCPLCVLRDLRESCPRTLYHSIRGFYGAEVTQTSGALVRYFVWGRFHYFPLPYRLFEVNLSPLREELGVTKPSSF